MYEIFIHDNSINKGNNKITEHRAIPPNYELKLIFESDKLYHSH